MKKFTGLFVLLLTMILPAASFAAKYETQRWQIVSGLLVIEHTGSSSPLKFPHMPGEVNGFVVSSLPKDTQVNLPGGWTLDTDGNAVTVSDMSRLKTSRDVDGLTGPAVRVFGPNKVTLNYPGLKMTARYVREGPEHPRYIAVHYQTWYRTPEFNGKYEWNWTLRDYVKYNKPGQFFDASETFRGQAKIASYHYPLTGIYSSVDRELQRCHAAWMRISGIDTVIFDFYGKDSNLEHQEFLRETGSFISNIIEPSGMNFIAFYEEFAPFDAIPSSADKTQAKAMAARIAKESMRWLQDNWFIKPGYVRHEGRPVLMVFASPQSSDKSIFASLSEWEKAASDAGVKPLPYFVAHSSWPDKKAAFNWMNVAASIDKPSERRVFTGPERVAKISSDYAAFREETSGMEYVIATAYPGFDSSITDELGRFTPGGSNHDIIAFDGGETFRQTFSLALGLKPDIIQLGTWNDYNESTVIEPSVPSLCHNKTEESRGYIALEYVQAQKREWENSEWTSRDLRIPLELYRLAKTPGVTEKQKAMIDRAYSAIFSDDAKLFRNIALQIVSWDISARPVLRVQIETAKTLPKAELGKSYKLQLSATGSTPIQWTIDSGKLPKGLKLSSSGKISGTPTEYGSFSVKVKAMNAAGLNTKTFTLKVTAKAPAVSTAKALPSVSRRQAYSQTLSATGSKPIKWSKTGGALPPGITLSTLGKLSGTPTKAGNYSFRLTASNAAGNASRTFTLKVTQTALTGSIPATITRKASCKWTLKASGGKAPYTWSISSGKLPDGLKLNASSGKISGIPTKAGTFKFTVKVKDKNGAASSKSFTVKATQTTLTGSIPATTALKSSCKWTVKASGGTSPYTFTVSGGKLPAGLSLNSKTGKISGTPTKAESYKFTLKAKDKNGAASTKSFTVKVLGTSTKSETTENISGMFIPPASLNPASDDVLERHEGRDNDIITVKAGTPLTFILGGWNVEVSGLSVWLNDSVLEGVSVSCDGRFTIPAGTVSGDFKVCVKAQHQNLELESETLYIIAE